MKKTRFLFIVTLFMVTSSAFAQLSSSVGGSFGGFGGGTGDSYNRFYFQYNPTTWDSDGSEISFNGFTLGKTIAAAFHPNYPFYLEGDFGLTYKKSKKDEMSILGIEMAYHFLSINVGLNVAWRMALPMGAYITPYAGIVFNGYALGRLTAKYEDEKESMKVFYNEDEFGVEVVPLALGWKIGVNLDFNDYYLGVSYGTDFTDMMEGDVYSSKFRTTSITLGLIY